MAQIELARNPLHLDDRIPTAGEQMLQGQYHRDFSGYVTANEPTDGAGSAPVVRRVQITRR